MIGLEPITCWLQISCSANWATSAYYEPKSSFLMTPTGIEPVLPPWKGDVLTAWPRGLFPSFPFSSYKKKSSPSRARTYNPSVNSRMLYHWAIEDHPCKLRETFMITLSVGSLLTIWWFIMNVATATNEKAFAFEFVVDCFFRYSVPSKLHTDSSDSLGQALDRLVTVSSIHCCTSTSALSTWYSFRGLTV